MKRRVFFFTPLALFAPALKAAPQIEWLIAPIDSFLIVGATTLAEIDVFAVDRYADMLGVDVGLTDGPGTG